VGHVARTEGGDMQVGFNKCELTGRQFGKSKERRENNMVLLHLAILMLTQPVVIKMLIEIIAIR
jgi:hypothetical protein